MGAKHLTAKARKDRRRFRIISIVVIVMLLALMALGAWYGYGRYMEYKRTECGQGADSAVLAMNNALDDASKSDWKGLCRWTTATESEYKPIFESVLDSGQPMEARDITPKKAPNGWGKLEFVTVDGSESSNWSFWAHRNNDGKWVLSMNGKD